MEKKPKEERLRIILRTEKKLSTVLSTVVCDVKVFAEIVVVLCDWYI